MIKYKAIDIDECQKLVIAWVHTAPILYQHLRHSPSYKSFIKAMVKIIVMGNDEEVVRVIEPGVYECLIMPRVLREELMNLWRGLYVSLPVHASQLNEIQELDLIIRRLGVIFNKGSIASQGGGR